MMNKCVKTKKEGRDQVGDVEHYPRPPIWKG